MSDQYPGYSDDYGGGSGEPPEWVGQIAERMDEIADQQYAMAQQLSEPAYDDDDAVYDDDDDPYGDNEVLPESEWEEDDGTTGDDIVDLFSEALDRRMAGAEEEEAIAERDEMYDELKNELEILQNPEAEAAIIDRALAITEATDPDSLHTPEFVSLVAKIALVEQFGDGVIEPASQGRGGHTNPYVGNATGVRDEGYRPPVSLEAAGGGGGPEGHANAPRDDWQSRVMELAARDAAGF